MPHREGTAFYKYNRNIIAHRKNKKPAKKRLRVEKRKWSKEVPR